MTNYTEKLKKLRKEWLRDEAVKATSDSFFNELAICLSMTIKKNNYKLLEQEVDDLIQLVCVEVYLNRYTVRSPLTYATAILRNQYSLMAKMKQRQLDLLQSFLIINGIKPECKAVDYSTITKLRDIITSLGFPDNHLVEESIFGKVIHADWAEKLGIPTNQVGMKVKRARSRFLRKLKQKHHSLYASLAELFCKGSR